MVNVNLIPISTRGVVKHQQLEISDGKITAIRPSGTPISNGSRVVDAHGAFALPGMFDMHVHIDDRQQLRLALSYGVTSVRNMDGMPIHLRWKNELSRGDWLGASLYSASPSVHGENYSSSVDIVVSDTESAASLVDSFQSEGWDQIKIYVGLGRAEYEAILLRAQALGIDVVGHVPYSVVETDYSLSAGMRTIEHVEEIFQGPLKHEFSLEKLSQVTRELYSIGSVVCPTLITFEHLTRISEEKEAFVETLPTEYMTPFGRKYREIFNINRWLDVAKERAAYNRKELEFLKRIVGELDKQSVELVVGTDSGTNFVLPGISMQGELRLMYESGLEAQTIFEAATINSARALRLDAKLGTLEQGKQADLVLYADNPLEDISVIGNPLMVVKNGELLDRQDLARIRREAKGVAGWWISTGRYLEAFLVRI